MEERARETYRGRRERTEMRFFWNGCNFSDYKIGHGSCQMAMIIRKLNPIPLPMGGYDAFLHKA